MTQLIDKRGKPLTVTFGDLKAGDFFQSEADCICMKIDNARGAELDYRACQYRVGR